VRHRAAATGHKHIHLLLAGPASLYVRLASRIYGAFHPLHSTRFLFHPPSGCATISWQGIDMIHESRTEKKQARNGRNQTLIHTPVTLAPRRGRTAVTVLQVAKSAQTSCVKMIFMIFTTLNFSKNFPFVVEGPPRPFRTSSTSPLNLNPILDRQTHLCLQRHEAHLVFTLPSFTLRQNQIIIDRIRSFIFLRRTHWSRTTCCCVSLLRANHCSLIRISSTITAVHKHVDIVATHGRRCVCQRVSLLSTHCSLDRVPSTTKTITTTSHKHVAPVARHGRRRVVLGWCWWAHADERIVVSTRFGRVALVPVHAAG
jgi:hypothetical protein